MAAYGAHRFKTTTPFGGDTYMTLADFMQYGAVQTDEEPLYIFDAYGPHDLNAPPWAKKDGEGKDFF